MQDCQDNWWNWRAPESHEGCFGASLCSPSYLSSVVLLDQELTSRGSFVSRSPCASGALGNIIFNLFALVSSMIYVYIFIQASWITCCKISCFQIYRSLSSFIHCICIVHFNVSGASNSAVSSISTWKTLGCPASVSLPVPIDAAAAATCHPQSDAAPRAWGLFKLRPKDCPIDKNNRTNKIQRKNTSGWIFKKSMLFADQLLSFQGLEGTEI